MSSRWLIQQAKVSKDDQELDEVSAQFKTLTKKLREINNVNFEVTKGEIFVQKVPLNYIQQKVRDLFDAVQLTVNAKRYKNTNEEQHLIMKELFEEVTYLQDKMNYKFMVPPKKLLS